MNAVDDNHPPIRLIGGSDLLHEPDKKIPDARTAGNQAGHRPANIECVDDGRGDALKGVAERILQG